MTATVSRSLLFCRTHKAFSFFRWRTQKITPCQTIHDDGTRWCIEWRWCSARVYLAHTGSVSRRLSTERACEPAAACLSAAVARPGINWSVRCAADGEEAGADISCRWCTPIYTDVHRYIHPPYTFMTRFYNAVFTVQFVIERQIHFFSRQHMYLWLVVVGYISNELPPVNGSLASQINSYFTVSNAFFKSGE